MTIDVYPTTLSQTFEVVRGPFASLPLPSGLCWQVFFFSSLRPTSLSRPSSVCLSFFLLFKMAAAINVS